LIDILFLIEVVLLILVVIDILLYAPRSEVADEKLKQVEADKVSGNIVGNVL
jgi:cellobiose-specific phosphotransferase system component IIC